MQRVILGLIALLAIIGGGAMYAFHGDQQDSLVGLGGLLLRVGMLLALIWLAWPDLAKIPFWIVGAMLAASIVMVWLGGWKALLLAIPAVLAFWLFVPRLRARPPGS
jgi:hypothetical protein